MKVDSTSMWSAQCSEAIRIRVLIVFLMCPSCYLLSSRNRNVLSALKFQSDTGVHQCEGI